MARSADRSRPLPTTTTGIRHLVAAWEQGFPAFCAAADLDHAAGAELAAHLRLLPARSQLTPERVAAVAEGRSVPSTTFARRWGVSRRTVADWRRSLALERISDRAEPRPPEPVSGVIVHRGQQVTLETADGRVRLGRSARALIDELVDHHPAAAHDARLRQAIFDSADERAAQAALHATVYRLRRHLPAGTIDRAGNGYRLNVPAESIRHAVTHAED